MLIYKIHKWLFSFALLASVVSFSSFIVYTETLVGSPPNYFWLKNQFLKLLFIILVLLILIISIRLILVLKHF